MNTEFKFIDLFAGIGGFHQSLESFGGECVFASEWEKNAAHVYELNYGIKPHGDITQIHEREIPKHDVLCAGFPCQAFSISGKQLGFEDTRGTLFFDVARIIKFHQPRIVLLENVKNFVRHDKGNTLNVVLKTLEELGYTAHYKVLKSSHFGVPQARERVYITGIRKDLANQDFEFPDEKVKPKKMKDILERRVAKEFFIERDDIRFYKCEKDIKDPYSPHQIGTINKGGQGERIYSIHSCGITLSAHGGGAAAKTGAYLINNKIRKLTPLECLRMQGFSDDFMMPVSKNIAYKLLGNSVSVPTIDAIFKKLAPYLENASTNPFKFKHLDQDINNLQRD
ncbi:MAG: DNA (cytosine-5-)-methyltransferase [Oligoflexia bacterium]|nr:DNA (cytosine-5-)-methyltransferase [Oligoflexia bacterium]